MSAHSLPGTQTATPARRRRLLWLWLSVAAFAYICDQLTKWWVTATLEVGERVQVVPGVLQWYHILNPGAAFSIGEGYTWVFTIVMAVVSAIIVFMARKIGSAWWALGLGLVLGGALGNLTDRLLRPPSFGMGHVVDFISFPNFAIFNMADMAVVGGVATICILTLLGINVDGRRVPAKDSAAQNAAAQDAGTPADAPAAKAQEGTND